MAQVKEILDNFHLQVIREHAIKNCIINGRARLGLVPPFSWMFADVTIERQIFYVYWADENAFFSLLAIQRTRAVGMNHLFLRIIFSIHGHGK